MTDQIYGNWRAYIQHDWATDDKKVYLYTYNRGDGDRNFAIDFVWKQVPEGIRGEDIQPLVTITRYSVLDNMGNFIQAIIDAAWDAGMRPANFKEHESELTATKYHLEDMRKIVFKP